MRPVILLLSIPVVAVASVLRPEGPAQPVTQPGSAAVTQPPVTAPADIVTLERRDVVASFELQGVVVPIGGEQLTVPATQNPSEFVLAQVLPHGSPVNKGDRIASLKSESAVERREASQLATQRAERALSAAQARGAFEQQARAANLALAEEDLQYKRTSLKAHLEVATELRKRAELLTEQRLQAAVDDQRDELAQLEAMYSQDELVDAVEQIVLSRARRGLAAAVSQLELNKDERAHADVLQHPRETRLMELGIAAAQRQLDKLNLDHKLAGVEQAAQLADAERLLARARADFELAQRVESGLVLVSPEAGVVLHGGIRVWERGVDRPNYRSGDRLPAGTPAFLVVPADRVGVALSLPAEQLNAARSAQTATARPAMATTAREGTLTVDAYPSPAGDFRARLTFPDPWVGVIVGTRAQVVLGRVVLEGALLLPARAVHVDGGGPWCFLVRSRADGGDEFVRRDVELGDAHAEGVLVINGLEAGDRVLLRETP